MSPRWIRRPSRRFVIAIVAIVCVGTLLAAYVGLRATGLFFVERLPVRFSLPMPTGPFSVGTVEVRIVDQERSDPWVSGGPRELMVSIWYPSAATAGHHLAGYMPGGAAEVYAESVLGPIGLSDRVDFDAVRTHAWEGVAVAEGVTQLPVVLFSPGGSLPRAMGTMLVEDLASHGFVVVTMDHTYEATAVEFPDGRVAVRTLPKMEGLLKSMIEVRIADARFVLDQLELWRGGNVPDVRDGTLPEGLTAAMDLSAVGMFGHSAGGFTTAEVMLIDPRVRAGINLDGSMAYRMSRAEYGASVTQGLDRPFMLMGAGVSGGPTRPHTHLEAPDWKAFWEASTGWKRDLYIPEGEHFTFTDYQAVAPQLSEKIFLPRFLLAKVLGTVESAQAVAAQRAYIRAFFALHLRGEAQVLFEGPSPEHPDVDIVG